MCIIYSGHGFGRKIRMGDISKSHNSLTLQQNFANFYQWMQTASLPCRLGKSYHWKFPIGASKVIYWLKVNGFGRKIRMSDISKSHNSLKPQQNFANFYQWMPTTIWVKKIIPLKIPLGGEQGHILAQGLYHLCTIKIVTLNPITFSILYLFRWT